ncbi:hypothetical protein M132_1555 [Bacteroides fragilis str. S24L15]|nr:hypothetical protein M132_1555 [Bacteroides fragilis str. S24L15]EYA74044.1 hypothetical protein M133_3822 [Bacteroides fragilis str. S24L26]EYA78622.1 hypothetical protein M134_3924 [Bacteroides fragilis str. S24L34]
MFARECFTDNAGQRQVRFLLNHKKVEDMSWYKYWYYTIFFIYDFY